MLQVFGVEARTEQVYRALLGHPGAKLDHLAGVVGMPHTALSAELDRLCDLRLVRAGTGPTEPWSPVSPEQALELLADEEERRLRERQDKIENARRDLSQLVDSFVQTRTVRECGGVVEHLDDPQVVASRVFQLLKESRCGVLSMLPGVGALMPMLHADRLSESILARNVPLRLVVAERSLSAPHWRTHLEGQTARGAQVRAHPSPPVRMLVVDERVALLPKSGAPGALVLNGRDAVAPVSALFDELWRQSVPVPASRDVEEEARPSEARLRQVTALLAQGLKDEAIARRLGVSTRTVRRLVAATMAELQADSRFQAGVLALKRGWLD